MPLFMPVVIVGAGHAGPATSHRSAARSIDHVVLERATASAIDVGHIDRAGLGTLRPLGTTARLASPSRRCDVVPQLDEVPTLRGVDGEDRLGEACTSDRSALMPRPPKVAPTTTWD